MEIIFATQNQNKVKEIQSLLALGFTLKSLAELNFHEDLLETADTLNGNAAQKASFVFDTFNRPCFADDSGLEVEALNGEPGVLSARYAGPDRNNDQNMNLLLENLKNHSNRKAQFRTVICFIRNGKKFYFEGVVKGTIIVEKKGDHGFGYDPIFMPDGYTKTFAEMSLAEKNIISHRSIAVRKLVSFLNSMT